MMNISVSPPNLAVPTPTATPVSNEEFIREVFRDAPPGSTALVCSKPGDPTTGGWFAFPPGDLPANNNNYVAASSFLPADGNWKNRREQIAAVHFLMLDDIGGKIPLQKLSGLKLSWLLETSPGNFQGGIIFKEPVSPDVAETLLKSIIQKGLCDPGATGAANRWARLPKGINGKAKYRDSSGKPFYCRLDEWRPEQRYDIGEIRAALGLEIEVVAGPASKPTTAPGAAAPRPQLPLDEALAKCRELLNNISPDVPYPDWIAAGMAIWHETGGHKKGAMLFDEWSSDGEKYPGAQEICKQWDSFRPVDNPRKMGTLVMLAKQYGYKKDEGLAESEKAGISGDAESAPPEPVSGEKVIPASPPAQSISTGELTPPMPCSDGQPQDAVALGALQSRYVLLRLDSKFWVVELADLAKRNSNGGAAKLPYYSQNDGKLAISRFLRKHYPQTNREECFREFKLSDDTTVYSGVEFAPVSTSPNLLNLWVGPTVASKEGDWKRIRDFLLNIICNGEQAAFDYLVGYLAHALQRPGEKPGVMVILIGGQGVGKGTLATILQRIWAATYLQVFKVEDITGNFNAALERAYIVFMDEALFVGDRKGSDALKSLVTESLITINEKYQPSRQIRSFHRFFAATNSSHFKNTESDDRRDFVLRVSEAKKGDRPYWDGLYSAINEGEVEALAHYLLGLDLSGFSVRDKPSTVALLEQKLMSLDHIARWWYDCLMAGNGRTFAGTNDLITEIMEMAGNRIHRKPAPLDLINKFRDLCPSAKSTQKQIRGHRQRGISFPPLAQARREFEEYIGSKIDWSERDEGEPAMEYVELPND